MGGTHDTNNCGAMQINTAKNSIVDVICLKTYISDIIFNSFHEIIDMAMTYLVSWGCDIPSAIFVIRVFIGIER